MAFYFKKRGLVGGILGDFSIFLNVAFEKVVPTIQKITCIYKLNDLYNGCPR